MPQEDKTGGGAYDEKEFRRRDFLNLALAGGASVLAPATIQGATPQGADADATDRTSAADALLVYADSFLIDQARQAVLEKNVRRARELKQMVSGELGNIIAFASALRERHSRELAGLNSAMGRDVADLVRRAEELSEIKSKFEIERELILDNIQSLNSNIREVQGMIIEAGVAVTQDRIKEAVDKIDAAVKRLGEMDGNGELIPLLKAVRDSLPPPADRPRPAGNGEVNIIGAVYSAPGQNIAELRRRVKEIIRNHIRPGFEVQVIIGFIAVWRILNGVPDAERRRPLLRDALKVVPRWWGSDTERAANELANLRLG